MCPDMRSLLFWDAMQHRLVGSNVLGLSAWPSKMVPIDCQTTLVNNYQSMLPNNSEQQTSHLHHGRSLKSGVLKRYSLPRQVWDLLLFFSHLWSVFKLNVFNKAGVLYCHEKTELQWVKVVNYSNTMSWTYDSERVHCFQEGWLGWKWQIFGTSINMYN
jgi:hypothetical protein